MEKNFNLIHANRLCLKHWYVIKKRIVYGLTNEKNLLISKRIMMWRLILVLLHKHFQYREPRIPTPVFTTPWEGILWGIWVIEYPFTFNHSVTIQSPFERMFLPRIVADYPAACVVWVFAVFVSRTGSTAMFMVDSNNRAYIICSSSL